METFSETCGFIAASYGMLFVRFKFATAVEGTLTYYNPRRFVRLKCVLLRICAPNVTSPIVFYVTIHKRKMPHVIKIVLAKGQLIFRT